MEVFAQWDGQTKLRDEHTKTPGRDRKTTQTRERINQI